MDPARIAELLEPFAGAVNNRSEPARGRRELNENDLIRISTYIDILLRWNARVNLTGIREPEEIVTRHFGESFFAARHLFPAGRTEAGFRMRLADLGSGAGFPGLPIKLWAPEITLTLIEANQKKATFLGEVVRALTLTDVNIQNVRAETLPSSSFDVVTLRAVERCAEALPFAANLLAPGGRLVMLIGSAQLEAVRRAMPPISWEAPIALPQSQSRVLLCGRLEDS